MYIMHFVNGCRGSSTVSALERHGREVLILMKTTMDKSEFASIRLSVTVILRRIVMQNMGNGIRHVYET